MAKHRISVVLEEEDAKYALFILKLQKKMLPKMLDQNTKHEKDLYRLARQSIKTIVEAFTVALKKPKGQA